VKEVYAEVRRLGGEVLAVSFAAPAVVARYLQRHPLPFPAVADPERAAYRALGMGRTSWKSILRSAVVFRYLALMVRGWLPGKSGAGEDLLQLGGDFVIDAGRRLVYAHPSVEPTDRPSVQELLRAVQAVTTGSRDRQ
jgi:peroxiredoxin